MSTVIATLSEAELLLHSLTRIAALDNSLTKAQHAYLFFNWVQPYIRCKTRDETTLKLLDSASEPHKSQLNIPVNSKGRKKEWAIEYFVAMLLATQNKFTWVRNTFDTNDDFIANVLRHVDMLKRDPHTTIKCDIISTTKWMNSDTYTNLAVLSHHNTLNTLVLLGPGPEPSNKSCSITYDEHCFIARARQLEQNEEEEPPPSQLKNFTALASEANDVD